MPCTGLHLQNTASTQSLTMLEYWEISSLLERAMQYLWELTGKRFILLRNSRLVIFFSTQCRIQKESDILSCIFCLIINSTCIGKGLDMPLLARLYLTCKFEPLALGYFLASEKVWCTLEICIQITCVHVCIKAEVLCDISRRSHAIIKSR